MATRFREHDNEFLFDGFRANQKGKGFGAQGSCHAGGNIFAVVQFFIPMNSSPIINLANITYANCENARIYRQNNFGFVIIADIISNGNAGIFFDWSADI
jgi:hypothetical protein